MRKIIRPCGLHCIKIKNFSVGYGDQQVLRDVNLHIHCGTLTSIIGRNGAGKSTLIKAIIGEIPHSGEIEFRTAENGSLRKIKIGYVPQSINIDRTAPISVYDLLAAYRSRVPVMVHSRKERARFIEALEEFSAEKLIDQPVGTLSGGQLQRVMLSLAVMDDPDLLLLDEPVSGIDKNGMDLFYEKMKYLKENHDLAVVLVSHDLDYVAKYSDKVVLLEETVAAAGTPQEVFSSEEFVRIFGGTSYDFSNHKRKSHSINLEEINYSSNARNEERDSSKENFHSVNNTYKKKSDRNSEENLDDNGHYDPYYKHAGGEKR